MGVRLLLVNPRFPESFWSFRWAVDEVLPGKRTINPPLGLATLAALCPPDWEVTIVDENVEPLPPAPAADIVGICGMGVQAPRQRALIEHYRGRGYYTVAGGSYASLVPESYAQVADTVVAGEAEFIWPRFCADWSNGTPQPLYRETGTVGLEASPVPRFDLLRLDRYTTATLQFSRGCPFRCEFCDIIVMFGRKTRVKAVEQVGRELDALRSRGVHNVFFVDDNLIGHKPQAKALLAYLADYQQRHRWQFNFGTEASLNMAQDPELLRLFRAANFTWVFIGIESPDEATLRATGKPQNLLEDPLASLRRIYSHGIDVLAGFIVGFDNDTAATFDRQYRFIVESGIQVAMVGLLTALPKTPLHARLAREGRLLPDSPDSDNTKPHTNVVPLHMSEEEMVAGYMNLYRRLTRDHAIAARIRNKLAWMPQPVYRGEYTLPEQLQLLWRLLTRGLMRGGPRRLWHFARSLPWRAPRKFPLVIVDWIAALAMRGYVERHFEAPAAAARVLATRFAALRRTLGVALQGGRARLALERAATASPQVVLDLNGWLDRRTWRRAARRLERLLRHSSAELVLHIGALHERELAHFERFLRRLKHHGHRVFIMPGAEVRDRLRIDASVFHLLPDATR